MNTNKEKKGLYFTFHIREWCLDCGVQEYEGTHYYLYIGPFRWSYTIPLGK
jgi:hypothetical protein